MLSQATPENRGLQERKQITWSEADRDRQIARRGEDLPTREEFVRQEVDECHCVTKWRNRTRLIAGKSLHFRGGQESNAVDPNCLRKTPFVETTIARDYDVQAPAEGIAE